MQNGLKVDGKQYTLTLKCFVCDTPARAFLNCTVRYTAKFACERCTVRGKKDSKTTVYSSTNCPERTDQSFRVMQQRDHHHTPSSLLHINPPINMIFIFLLDFMHLCFLRVMKKLLEWWMNDNLNVRFGIRIKN